MLFLDLAKACGSVGYWALDDAMRGLGALEPVLKLLRALDDGAQARVLVGGAAHETGWVDLERGAAQGEVMSPLRFIAWMNLLLEALDAEGVGYSYQGGTKPYPGQAYC